MNNITVNMDNLSTDERNTLLKLVEKANKPKNKVWKPDDGELYYTVTGDTSILEYKYRELSDDIRRYTIGNCFKTKEEAEFALEKQKVITELKRFALENNECELDWSDTDKKKYFIAYNYKDKFVDIVYSHFKKLGENIYFSSADIAKQAIKTIGEDRLKKYYFEVNDNE